MQVFRRGDAAFGGQINEVGKNIPGCGTQQAGGHVAVDHCCERCCVCWTVLQGCKDFRLSSHSVTNQPVQTCRRVRNCTPMTRIEYPPVFVLQLFAGGHEIGQIAIRRRNKGRRPSHDVISGKADIFPGKAQMIPDMARCMDGAQGPVRVMEGVSVPEWDVRRESGVDAFTTASHTGRAQTAHHVAHAGICRAEGMDAHMWTDGIRKGAGER